MRTNPSTRYFRQASSVTAALLGTVVARAEEDIRDIRGPKALTGAWITPTILIAVLLVVLCACGLWLWRVRVNRPRIPTLAEATLARLESTRVLMLPAKAREFGIAASEVMRGYIEKRFDVLVTKRTTEEFLQTLLQSTNTALSGHRALLEEFLRQCDLVKFAGATLAQEDMESLLQSARAFVLQTSESAAA